MSKVLLLILLICTTGMLCAVTRIVDIDGSGQYTTIQSAINASVNGDVVLVYPGRYLENVVIQTNGITLQSLEATSNNPAYIDSTIIDGNATNTCLKIYSNTQNIQIRGFSITNGLKNGNGGGIQILPNTTSYIKNCLIYQNLAVGGAGILVAEGATFLSGVKIYNNRSLGAGGGILILDSGSVVNFDQVNRCSIYNNIGGVGQDIYVYDARVDIEVFLDMFTVLNPSNYFAQYYNNPGYQYHMNLYIQNAYTQEIDHDMYVSPDGNDENDGFSLESPLKTIQTAIYRTASDSLNPKTVHILPGTYSVTANQQIFPITMKSFVNVIGSGMDNTFIIGEHHPSYPDSKITLISSDYQRNYILQNMNIVFAEGVEGYLIFGMDEKNLTIKNMKTENMAIINSTIFYFGYLRDSVIDGLVVDNLFFYQRSIIEINGGFNGIMKNWKITNCISNEQDPSNWTDPLIWLNLSDTSIENCVFENLVMRDDDSQCLSFGGIDNPNQPLTMNITNCLFSHIIGEDGIIHFQATNNPNINITNSTFADCDGHDYTITTNGVVNIHNTIFRNNTPYEIRIYPMTNGEHSNLTFDYNCIPNGSNGIYNPGTGNQIHYLGHNTTANPLFNGVTNPDMPFYSLTENSPCKDTGTPDTTGLFLPVADIAGHYRVWGESIDMGCYEFGSPVGNEDYLPPEVGGTLYNFPNPFNPSTTISYCLKEDGKVSLEIFNIKGQLVKSLTSGFVTKGMHSIVWDGKDEEGKAISSGVYFYRLTTSEHTITRKMILMK